MRWKGSEGKRVSEGVRWKECEVERKREHEVEKE